MASSEEEITLKASLDLYKGQLNQIEACLQSDENGLNRDDLVQLQNDLEEIIHLTEQNIAAIHCKRLESLDENFVPVTSSQQLDGSPASEAESQLPKISSFSVSESALSVKDNTLDAEYANFQRMLAGDLTQFEDEEAGVKDDKGVDNVIQIDSDEDNEEAIEIGDTSSEDSEDTEGGDEDEEEDDVFGQKCQAPFSHHWGQRGYYNAIVLARAKNVPKDSEPMVEVVFCYPTHCSMRLCPYYLSGNCRYDTTKCRYSHGEAVKISDLRSFEDPDFSYVAVGSPCLVRDDDDIWYEATIMEILDDAEFHIQFKANHHLKTVSVKDLFPLSYEPQEDVHSHVDDDEDVEKADEAFAPSFSSPVDPVDIKTTDALGQWEMHTKGIGSKLMAKMGYVAGQGLGRNNEGRAEPVRIELLPKGLSLDKIMELKNLANNNNLFDALKKQKRKQKQQNLNKKDSKSTEGPKTKSPSVFDFINNKLRPKKVKHRNPRAAKDTKFISTRELRTKSDKHLNIQLMKTNGEIKNTERQILHLKDSIQRANDRGDHVASKELTKKIDSLRTYTTQLQSSEALMQNHKKSRKAHSLLTKF